MTTTSSEIKMKFEEICTYNSNNVTEMNQRNCKENVTQVVLEEI